MPSIWVASRYCGPPGTANGGYLAGLLSGIAACTVTVRLRRPVPLEVALAVEVREAGSFELMQGQEVLATATPATLDIEAPAPPDYLSALEASRRYIGFHGHAFPRCFVCGPERARGDGLRIFAGALNGGAAADRAARGRAPASGSTGEAPPMVAAPWTPDASLAGGDGKVRPEFMWAALDCPGYFAARTDGVAMLLGEFTAHVDRLVHVDEPCVLVGWQQSVDGRRHLVGTALYDEDGELCGKAQAVWVEPRPANASADMGKPA